MRVDPPAAVALDVPDIEAARRLLDATAGLVRLYKVGLELFTAEGPRAVHQVQERGADVFLDLKVNDIPKTVAGAVRSAVKIGATFLTVHSNAGAEAVHAAVEEAAGRLHVLVVSVLTSLDDAVLADLGVSRSAADQVDAMARLASEAGADGLVLGAGEAARVRSGHPELFLVTPGIRPASLNGDDQRRTGTPAAAIAAGSDLLVLARAACDVPDPRAAVVGILEQIAGARV